jgi:hypothetical protein
MKKQQIALRGKPRGRPFLPGVSGNPRGRPPGARNKLSLMVEEGIRRAKAELAKPKMLDQSRPFESWDGYFFQDGLRFNKYTLEAIPTDGPHPLQPKMLNPRVRRTSILWKKRDLTLQNGWAFDPATWEAVKL